MKQSKSVMAPTGTPRTLKEPTTYPESETDQKATMSIAEMFERYNMDPDKMDENFFDPSESEYLQRFLKPNLDLTDLDELKKFQENLGETINEKIKKQLEEETQDKRQPEPAKPKKQKAKVGNKTKTDKPLNEDE